MLQRPSSRVAEPTGAWARRGCEMGQSRIVPRFGDENVYKLVSNPEQDKARPPLYRSKHNGKLEVKEMSFGARDQRLFATMGLAKGVITSKPEEFLHKHTGYANMSRGAKSVQHKPAEMICKASLVSRKDRPVMGLHSERDCVHANALETIRMHPPPPKPGSPLYMQKPDYGKVPDYLQQNKAEIAKEKARADALLLAAEQEKASKILPEEERLQLLRQLKLKWAQINSQFLRLPFTLDTPAKRRRKEIYEAQLAQIEKDVRLLQSSEKIVITTD